MGATEEQMALLSAAGVTHVSYVLILYSIAFVLFLFVLMLVHLYAVHAWPASSASNKKKNEPRKSKGTTVSPRLNGYAKAHGDVERLARDAEEFELEGLITDEEREDSPEGIGRRKETAAPNRHPT